MRYADRIGYLSHDALDAVRAGVLRPTDLPARARAVFGEPGSHGCVNLPVDMAAFLYGWAPLGTPVWVHE